MSLQIWLPLINDCHNQGLIECNVQSSSESTASFIDGKLGKCLSSTKSEFNFDVPNMQNIVGPQKSWSITCWIKFKSTSGSGYLIALDVVGQHAMYFNLGSDPRLVWNESGDNGKRIETINLDDISTRWYHVAVTLNKTPSNSIIETCYIDGQQTRQFTWTSTTQLDVTYPILRLFGNTGYYNDVRVYDHCLSPKEVEEISKGLITHFKLDGNRVGNPNLLLDSNAPSLTKVNAAYNRYIESSSSGTYTITWETIPDPPAPGIINGVRENVSVVGGHHSVTWYNGSLVSVVVGDVYTISCYVKVVSGTNLNFSFQYGKSPYVGNVQTLINDNKWHQYHWTFTPNDTAAADGTTRIYGGGLSSVGEVLICGWKLEKGDCATPWCEADVEDNSLAALRNTIQDSSGYGRVGVAQNNIGLKLITPSPKYSLATYFDGNDYLNVITPRNFDTGAILKEYSVSYWLYFVETAEQPQYIISNPICTNYIRASNQSYANSLFISWLKKYSDDSTSTNSWSMRDMTAYLNQWVHICIVFDGDMHLYINGNFYSTSTRGGSIQTVDRDQSIGYNAKSLKVSDVREYATALTQSQIEELYNTSMSIDNIGNIYARELVE